MCSVLVFLREFNLFIMEQSIYILQRDMPDVKLGMKYYLNGERYYPLTPEFTPKGCNISIPKHIVENNPEWFKKEEPKQWEILSVSEKDKIYYKAGVGSQFNINGIIIPQEIVLQQCKIHSVKRLSDNEVFTVGDSFSICYKTHIITGFEIDGTRMKVLTHAKGDWQFLSSIFKVNPSLKEQPLPIKVTGFKHKFKNEAGGYVSYCFTTHEIPESKYEPIKKAIQFVLNYNEHPLKDSIGNNLYTHDDYIEAQQKAFAAGKETITFKSRYQTFHDYIESLNK